MPDFFKEYIQSLSLDQVMELMAWIAHCVTEDQLALFDKIAHELKENK
jgi:hypothetical protein